MTETEVQRARVLRRIHQGIQPYSANILDVAYLIANDLVKANIEKRSLSLTEKGKAELASWIGPLDLHEAP